MSKNKGKDKKHKPLPKPNRQIPNSMIKPFSAIGVNPILQQAREFPIHGCWVMGDWKETGITPVIVARKQPNGKILFGLYLVDYYCLGIKDAFTRTDYSLNRFDQSLGEHLAGNPKPCSIDFAHELVYGALEYAEKLGFHPHPDFKNQKADLVLDPPDAHPRKDKIKFGKDGKPFFIAGPYDDAFRINHIINTLIRTCGEGNFHYLAGIR